MSESAPENHQQPPGQSATAPEDPAFQLTVDRDNVTVTGRFRLPKWLPGVVGAVAGLLVVHGQSIH